MSKLRAYGERMTTFRTGMIGGQSDTQRDELFIDPSPYFSLRGLGLHHNVTPEQRSKMAAKNPRAHTDMGEPARNRSAGRESGPGPKPSPNPIHERGAPPWPLRRN